MTKLAEFTWERGGVYLRGDQLVRPGGDAHVAETYQFRLVPLPDEDAGRPACLRFAALGDSGATDEAILAFANRYGLLGFSRLDSEALSRARDVQAQIAEDLGIHWAREARARELANAAIKALQTYKGPLEEWEAVKRWRTEATSLSRVVVVMESISLAEEGRVGDALANLHRRVSFSALPSGEFRVWEVPLDDKGLHELTLREIMSWPPEHFANELRREAARLINYRLAGRAQLVEHNAGHFTLMPAPATLLEALYVQLAFLLYQERLVRICADPQCGVSFIPDHGNQRYCSVRCKERHKKERYRRKSGARS